MQQLSHLSLHAAAWFFVGSADESGEQKIVRIQTPFRVGRNPDADLCLKCTSVSGNHAEILEINGELWLQDLNSTNGTFVNGRRISARARLTTNDSIQFGTAVFHVHQDQESDDQADVQESAQNIRFERLFSDGVVPFFQPIVKIDNGGLVVSGYEVLGRSRLFGLRTPAQMFAAASRLEMEAELSRALRIQGIRVADNSLPEELSLFVNTHPAEIECDGLEESLFEIRDNHPSRPITLEVHESVLNDPEKFLKLRTTLQNIDIQLAVHDFGAGQIRLAELCDVVPDIVKFDVRLVRGIDRASAKRQQFVATMVKLVRELGIVPMAECVEQQNEHQTIKQMGFQLGQGFHYGRACSISDCSPKSATQSHVDSNNEIPQVKSFLAKRDISSPASRADSNVNSGGPKNADWLLKQPASHYTIQVLSAISEQSAKQFISMQSNPDEFAIFCKQGKTRRLYIVVFGTFGDRTTAKEASGRFTNATVSPWIRMLSSVHAEIER